MSRNNNQSTAVATLQPPRMQMPANVGEEYGLNLDSWRALTDAVFPSAKSVGAVVLALAYCKRHRLDVFQRVVHIVPMKVGGKDTESVWPGIGLLRVIAQRQPEFGGFDECEFGPDIEDSFEGFKTRWERNGDNYKPAGSEKIEKRVTYPEWAQFSVYKIIGGERVRMPGPRVYWRETYATMGRDNSCPNEMWEKRPRGQLEKCAEAAALRRAFPDVLGNEYAMEEMAGRDVGHTIDGHYVEVEEGGGPKPAAPRRAEFERGSGSVSSKAQPNQQTRNGDQKREDAADTGAQLREEERDRPEPKASRGSKPEALDGPGIPETEEDWQEFETLLRGWLESLPSKEAIDQAQADQQFRLDAADPDRQQDLYLMISEIAGSKLPEADLRGGSEYIGAGDDRR